MPGTDLAPWRVLPAYIVRPAGFAFDRLAALAFPRSLDAASALRAARAARMSAGHRFDHAVSQERYGDLAELDEPAVRKQFSRHIKRARAFARGETAELPAESLAEIARVLPGVAGAAAELRASQAACDAAEQGFEAGFAAELDERRAALRAIYAGDARLREAVFLESPEAFERVQQLVAGDGPRDARARQRERLAAMYLQRFCAKNDTNSICGPHAVARVIGGPAVPRVAITGEERRQTYFSHWAAERLLEAASQRAGHAEVTLVRVHPTVRLDGAAASWCAIDHDATVSFRRRYARANLPEAAVQLIGALAQRPRATAELERLAATELDLTADELGGLIDQLCELGLLVRRPTLAPGLFHPLDAAADEIARWRSAEPHAEDIRALGDLTSAFAGAALPERLALYRQMIDRFRDATGDTAERGQGRHYADRTILHEDCHATIEASIGRETVEPLLAALVPLVEAAALPLDLARENVRHWFAEAFGAGRRVPLLDAHRAFDEAHAADRAAPTPTADAIRAGIARVRACFAAALDASSAGPVRVAPDAIAAALDGTPRGRPGYVSADIMLGGAPGAHPQLVLGEVHGFCWLPTCLLDVVPEPARAEALADMRGAIRALAGGRHTVECQFAHTQATDRRFAITDGDLLLVDPSDPRALCFGRLDLELTSHGFRFLDGDREVVPVSVYHTYPFLGYTSPLAPLVDDFAGKFFPDAMLPDALAGAEAPRMQVGEVVFRRRTWQRTAGELAAALGAGKPSALLRDAQTLRERIGLPRHVFASFASEPKPVLVDLDSLFLIETFAHLAGRQAAESAVRMTEMLPGPDELFAVGPDGRRTSELRMGFYRLGT